MDKVQNADADRIAQSLALDGDSHPSKINTIKEIRRINASKHTRKDPTKKAR